MPLPRTGSLSLRRPDRHQARQDIVVRAVRSLDDLQRVFMLRAITYIVEQDCPYDEEFDGNDLCALHLLAMQGAEPVGSLRLRFFNGFCKVERVCVAPKRRGGAVFAHLMGHAFEIASRKGYRRMLAHIQARLEAMWRHATKGCVIDRSERFAFSSVDYLSFEIALPEHPDAIAIETDPFVLIRPEGSWDQPGVLEGCNAGGERRAA